MLAGRAYVAKNLQISWEVGIVGLRDDAIAAWEKEEKAIAKSYAQSVQAQLDMLVRRCATVLGCSVVGPGEEAPPGGYQARFNSEVDGGRFEVEIDDLTFTAGVDPDDFTREILFLVKRCVRCEGEVLYPVFELADVGRLLQGDSMCSECAAGFRCPLTGEDCDRRRCAWYLGDDAGCAVGVLAVAMAARAGLLESTTPH